MPRAYHSGDYAEIDWILKRLVAEHPDRPIVAVGVSLGGNALVHWAGKTGAVGRQIVQAIAAISSPLDLTASGHAIGKGFNRVVYTRMFLHSMVPKALQKLAQFPGLFSREALLSARNLYEFDNVFTAPLHGFRNADEYWQLASAKPLLGCIRVPTLLLNALNDPFVPGDSLPKQSDASSDVTLWQPPHGGHVGFPSQSQSMHKSGQWLMVMPQAVMQWLARHIAVSSMRNEKVDHG